jgi:hypothetical protein
MSVKILLLTSSVFMCVKKYVYINGKEVNRR